MGFPCGSAGKESSCNAGDLVPSLGWEDPLKKRKEQLLTPVFLPGKSPWTEEPGGLQSRGLQSWT